MNAYIKPRVETLRAEQVVEAMGPAQGYGGSSGNGGVVTVYPGHVTGDPYHFNRQ